MKKQITVDGFQCDGCGKETEYAAECRNCNKSFCLNCMGTEMREYQNRGTKYYYCYQCDQLTDDDTINLLRLIKETSAARLQAHADHTKKLDQLSKRLETELVKEQADKLPF